MSARELLAVKGRVPPAVVPNLQRSDMKTGLSAEERMRGSGRGEGVGGGERGGRGRLDGRGEVWEARASRETEEKGERTHQREEWSEDESR